MRRHTGSVLPLDILKNGAVSSLNKSDFEQS